MTSKINTTQSWVSIASQYSLLLLSSVLLLLLCIQTPSFCQNDLEFPVDYIQWVKQRVGPVVYPERSTKTWRQWIDLAAELECRAVKTWIAGDSSGQIPERMEAGHYLELIDRFEVVHINVCHAYLTDGYTPGNVTSEVMQGLKQDWRDLTMFLCQNSKSNEQVFLLSVCAEINVYLGTEGVYPEFPIAEYVNNCHDGMREALEQWGEKPRPHIYSVAELQGDKEFESFAEKWVPEFETDLVSLSHYTFYRNVTDSLNIIRKHLKSFGPFGENRLMLGEYGPSLQVCNWNQSARVRWHDEILRNAFAQGVQFAFFYELADHEFVISTGSHDGLVTWTPEPFPRLSWDYYQQLYQGIEPAMPDFELYEVRRRMIAPIVDAASPNLVVLDLQVPEKSLYEDERVVFEFTVKNTGNAPSQPTSVNFFGDDRMFSWVWISELKPGESFSTNSAHQDQRFKWQARPGAHRITAVVDPTDHNAELSEEDNSFSRSVQVIEAERK